jgi:O-antigen/teichoic acid export membrane protein
MVLSVLGVEGYGIYSVVSGVVTMLGFLSGSMAYATQRFISIELGNKNFERLKLVFSASLFVYLLIAIVVIALAETIGLWFVNNKLIIPPGRISAALWIYQASIISFVFSLLTTPYMSLVLAHEDMGLYALLSIIKTCIELLIVILLQYINADKLRLYGALVCAVMGAYFFIYMLVCKIKYRECTLVFGINKGLFKKIIAYNGWMLFASFAGVFKDQIVNILLNQFFGPVVVASRAIASQVNVAVSSFFQNFNMALRPPIVKHYAAKETGRMIFLVFCGTKASFFLMYLFSLPLLLEMPLVLSLWLKEIPEYAALFTRLALIDVLISSITYPLSAAALASRKIGLYETVLGGSLLLNLPASWIAFKFGAPAYSCLVIAIALTFFVFWAHFILVKKMIDFPVTMFFKEVLLPLLLFTILSALLPLLVFRITGRGLASLFLTTGASVVSLCVCMYFIGLNGKERNFVRKMIIDKLSRIHAAS